MAYRNYTAVLSGTLELTADYPINANLNLFANNAYENYDLSANIKLQNTIKNLFVDGSIDGALQARIRGIVEPLSPGFPVNAGIRWENNGWPLDTQTQLKSNAGALYIKGTPDEYEIEFQSNIVGEKIPESRIDIKGTVNPQQALIPNLNIFTLNGFVTGSAAVNWSDGVLWTTDLIAKEINPGLQWQDMEGALNGIVRANGSVLSSSAHKTVKNQAKPNETSTNSPRWTLNITQAEIDGTLREFPFNLKTKLAKSAQNQWGIPLFELNNGPNTINASGTIATEINVTANVDFPAIQYLIPDYAGNLQAKATLSGNTLKPDVELTANSSVLKLPGVLLRNVNLNTSAPMLLEQPGETQLTIGTLNAGANQFDAIVARLDGSKAAHSLALRFDAPGKANANMKFTGKLDPPNASSTADANGASSQITWTGALVEGTIKHPAHQWRLETKPDLKFDSLDGTFSVASHCWKQLQAKLCLEKEMVAGASGQVVVSLSDYRLNYLNKLINSDARLGGVLQSKATINWNGDAQTANQAFNVDLSADIDRAAISVSDTNGKRQRLIYDSLQLKSNIAPSNIESNLAIKSKNLGNGNISFSMDPRQSQKPIAGNIAFNQFNVGFLSAFLPEIDRIDGDIGINGSIQGSLSAPQFNGKLELAGAVLQSENLPLSIDGGNIALSVSGDSGQLSGKLKSGEGNILLGGSVAWPNNLPEANITVSGKSLSIKQNPIVSSRIDPSLTIRYKSNGLQIGGEISIPAADINIKELPEGTTSLSGDVVIIEEEVQKKREATAPSKLKLNADIDIKLGDKVNLTGYGLQAKLSGNFNVNQSENDPPQLLGEILVSEGLYKSYGQDLSIKDGQILFVGPVNRTTLNIDAIREIKSEDRIAGLHLDGPIKDPVVTLFTTPADKSQESILSYIVLGRDLGGSNTNSEQNLLANAALALTLRQGRGFATGFAESLGISDFALEADGSGDQTQVVVSGRVSSKLLLRYGRSVFVPQDTLYLRYDISKRLYLEAAQGVERAVDLFYSFSF